MSTYKEFFEQFQANNRARRQELIDEQVSYVHDLDITNAASAMIEAGIEQSKIKELLIKYWDLRPSDASTFIQNALKSFK